MMKIREIFNMLFGNRRRKSNRDIIKNIGELHQKYIKLFIDLDTHKSIVDADFYIAAQAALTEQYEAELELLRLQAKPLNNEKFYLAESKISALGIYTYRQWFKHYNSTMKQILDERTAREAEGYFDELCSEPEPEEPEEAPEQAQTPDSADEPVVSEEPEEEPFDLITVKREIESDDLIELYELEEKYDEDSSDEDQESEPEQLLALPESTDDEQTPETSGSDDEDDEDNNEE